MKNTTKKAMLLPGWQVCKWPGTHQESPDRPCLFDNPESMQNRNVFETKGIVWHIRERDAPMGREEERAEVGMSLIQAPGTVASSNNSPLCWLSHFSLPRWGHFIMHRPVPLRAVSLLRLSCARILV